MADSTVRIQEPGLGTETALMDTEQVEVGENTVERERIEIAGAGPLEIAAVKNSVPATSLYGVVVRPVPHTDPTPISAVALPLPAGAATQTTLATMLSQTDFDTQIASLIAAVNALETLSVGNFPATQAASVADGADVTLGALADAAVAGGAAGSISAKLRRLTNDLAAVLLALGSPLQAGGAVSVSNFPATQTVSGTVTANVGTGTQASSIADGSDVAEGAIADAAVAAGAAGSVSAKLRRLTNDLGTLIAAIKNEDAVHASGDPGIQALGVRKDTAVALGADGDYHPPIFDATGRLWANTELPDAAALADGTTNPTVPAVATMPHALNAQGTWDRDRSNLEGTLLASGARTTDTDTADQVNYKHHVLVLYLNITAVSAGGIRPLLQLKDPVTGTYGTFITATPAYQTTIGLKVYQIGLGASGAGGVLIASQTVTPPRTWRVRVETQDGLSSTFSLGYALLQ